MAEQEKIQKDEEVWDKMTKSPKSRIIIGILIGIGFLIAGFYDINKAMRLEKEGVKAEAVIVSVRDVYKRKGGHKVYPTVRFTDKNGASHEVELGNTPSAQENQKVTVLYVPSSPKTAAIDSPSATSRVGGYLLFGFSAVGWIIVLYNVIALMVYKKRYA